MPTSHASLVLFGLLAGATALDCDCGGETCNTSHSKAYGRCWEADRSDVNQNCSTICQEWDVGKAWRPSASRSPSTSVDVQLESSWSCKLPGALELVTGGGTHMTMAYFEGGNLSCTQAVSESMAYAKDQGYGTVAVSPALTYLWGCGPDCAPSATLVDVRSPLARLKFGLIQHFVASGMRVDISTWGSTAHIQTVWAAPSAAPPAVRINATTIVGSRHGGSDFFGAIRYGLAPVGPLRLVPSRPYVLPHGTLDAEKSGPGCPQFSADSSSVIVGDEDCLRLDIVKPHGLTAAPVRHLGPKRRSSLPLTSSRALLSRCVRAQVYVWIHGGGLTSGQASTYNLTQLCERGQLVCVSIQ
jgi:hypothetical protein